MTDEAASWRVSWDEAAQIARTQWLPGGVCGLEEAQAIVAAIRGLEQGRVRNLVDIRQIDSIDRPAREFFMSRDAEYRAVAIFVDSAPSRMLGNFFIGLKRERVPLKLFTSEAEAVSWLQAQS